MKTLLLVAAFGSGWCGHAASVPSDVVYIPHDQIDAFYSRGGHPWLLQPTFKVQTAQRVAPGAVEMHTYDTDVFYIVEGRATFVTGGKAGELVEKTPGEWRGKSLSGGTIHNLSAGDVIVISNGVPHQYTAIDGTFRYFVVKITEK